MYAKHGRRNHLACCASQIYTNSVFFLDRGHLSGGSIEDMMDKRTPEAIEAFKNEFNSNFKLMSTSSSSSSTNAAGPSSALAPGIKAHEVTNGTSPSGAQHPSSSTTTGRPNGPPLVSSSVSSSGGGASGSGSASASNASGSNPPSKDQQTSSDAKMADHLLDSMQRGSGTTGGSPGAAATQGGYTLGGSSDGMAESKLLQQIDPGISKAANKKDGEEKT